MLVILQDDELARQLVELGYIGKSSEPLKRYGTGASVISVEK
jgi:hypothetical protein